MERFDYKKTDMIMHYLPYNYYNTYNANINTMIMWNHVYDIYYKCEDNYMIMLYSYGGKRFFVMPYCNEKYFPTAINFMIRYAKEHDFEFSLSFASFEFVEYIKNNYNELFVVRRTDYNDDYIYNVSDHLYLTGKKMQKRRNHYNIFIKEYPDYLFKQLDPIHDRNDIIQCFNNWDLQSLHGSKLELEGIENLLKYGVDIYCYGIYINNKIEAISICSLLNPETLQIHVEKANRGMRGIYPALLKNVLESNFSDIKYINREDDIGIEGLRKSKTQLHPVYKLEKYEILLKDLQIRKANDKDTDDIKKLWLESFDDEDIESTEYYFNNIYNNDHTYLLFNKNTLISCIQYNPIVMNDGSVYYFIVGVCTRKDYQRQGFMDYLLKHTMCLYNDRLILQAYNEDVYKKYGFKVTHKLKEYFIKKDCIQSSKCLNEIDLNILLSLYNQYCTGFKIYRKRDFSYYEKLYKRCESYGMKILSIDDGYMIYSESDDYSYVHEIIYLNENAFYNLLGHINNKDLYVMCDSLSVFNYPYKYKTSLMSNTLTDSDEYSFINEIY